MKKILTSISVVIITIVLFMNCDDSGITEGEYQIKYLREQQLTNIFNNEIIVLSTLFSSETEKLSSEIENFKTNTTLDNLTKTRNSWVNVLKIWKRLELYNLGAVENSFIHFEINRWPTNTTLINKYIDGVAIMNEAFVTTKGSSSKGISAIEYLLYSDVNQQKVRTSFITSPNNARRLDYLLALSKNLESKAVQLKNMWNIDKSNFISSIENGTSGSQNQLTNALISIIEEIIIKKLGNPLGNTSGGKVNIEKLEAYRSETSLGILQEHLTVLKRCFLGSFKEKSIKWGYDNYLTLIGNETITPKVLEAFEIIQQNINSINGSLKNELLSNPDKIVKLRQKFTDLLVLIKVDLANTIGATVTISDNDGD